MNDQPIFNGVVATGLITSHFWASALQVVSTTASIIATVTGAIIGVVTLYRMYKGRK